MRGLDLAFGSLQEKRAVAVKDARGAEVQGRGVEAAGFAAARGLGADKAHGLVPEEATENANGVGTAAHAGDHGVRKLAGLLENLLPGFLAHNALELGDQFREGSRACGCAEAVVGGLLVGDPAAQGFVNGVLQSAGAAVHGVHRSAEHFHAHDVHGLALGVLGAHEDGAFEAEAGGRGGRGHAVLSGAGFGDEGCLAHFFGEQGLTERIVHLVGARVEQILTLQPEVEAQFLREVGAESQRRGTAGVVEKQVMEFVLELFGGHDVAHGLIHFQKGRHEQFGYEAAPVFTIVSCAVHSFPRGPPVVPGPMARPPFVSLG